MDKTVSRTTPNIKMTEKSKELFFLVSYNIDKFRRFVFESSFLSRYDLEEDVVEKIRKDELELMHFGIKWLKEVLFDKDRVKNMM